VRAAGPFGHAILAGTAGAAAITLCYLLRHRDKWRFLAGTAACLVIVVASASSGPIMTAGAGLFALALWRWRSRLRWFQWGGVLAIAALHIIMKAPVWYLLARIDLAGGSTGWHRAELITAAVEHFDEWWLLGTDYTRHWIPYGVLWSTEQIDITNYYLKMGVIGGLALMLIFIAILFKAFQLLGAKMRSVRGDGTSAEFILWCVGATLFAHCVTFFAIGYFDQSYVFLFLLVGSVPGLTSAAVRSRLSRSHKPVPQPAAVEIRTSRRFFGTVQG